MFVVGLLPAEGHVADLAELDALRIAWHASKFGLLTVPEIDFNFFFLERVNSFRDSARYSNNCLLSEMLNF